MLLVFLIKVLQPLVCFMRFYVSFSEVLETEDRTSTHSTPEGGENIAELLRLLQAIGGVERLQSLLGAQEASKKQEEEAVTLPQYAAPHR